MSSRFTECHSQLISPFLSSVNWNKTFFKICSQTVILYVENGPTSQKTWKTHGIKFFITQNHGKLMENQFS